MYSKRPAGPIWFWGTVDYVLVSDHQWSNFISEQKMDRVCWNSFSYLFKLHNWHCREHYWGPLTEQFLLIHTGVFWSWVFNFNIITQMKIVILYFLKLLFGNWIGNTVRIESHFASWIESPFWKRKYLQNN